MPNYGFLSACPSGTKELRRFADVLSLGTQNHSWTPQRVFPEARRASRYKLETEIRVYSRTHGRVNGHTGDISESGIGALLKLEVPLGQVVQLEFQLPSGSVAALALV